MKSALYREFLLVFKEKGKVDIIKELVLYFAITVVLIIITKNSATFAFLIAFSIGLVSTNFGKDEKNGTLAILKAMPIKTYKYILARYINLFIGYLFVAILLSISGKVALIFGGITDITDFIMTKNIAIIIGLILIIMYIPGNYAFTSKGIGIIIYSLACAIFLITIMYLLIFKNGFSQEYFSINTIFILLVVLVITFCISLYISIKIVENKDF